LVIAAAESAHLTRVVLAAVVRQRITALVGVTFWR
jgi:hypothetical protein